MSRTIFFTDPHLGLGRAANTTPKSAEALQDALWQQVKEIIGLAQTYDFLVCLGDVFDRYSNPERITAQGLELCRNCSLVLSGNHDVVNRESQFGSLQLVDHVLVELNETSPCIFAKFGKSHYDQLLYRDFTVVPHVASQQLFEESLGAALETADGARTLLLHCNYQLSEERADATTLNLKAEHVEELLGPFKRIMLGHEHIPRDEHDGRVIVLGNIHPTSFSDISDKRIGILENGKLRFEQVWSKERGSLVMDYHDLPRATDANFLRVTGQVEINDMIGVTRRITDLWGRSPSLYGVKVEVALPGVKMADGQDVQRSLHQLPELIRRELQAEPQLLEMWDQLVQEESTS